MTTSILEVARAQPRRRKLVVVLAVLVAGMTSCKSGDVLTPSGSAAIRLGDGWASVAWPAQGAAAAALGRGHIHTSGGARAAPIASLAKVMTALVVLRSRQVTAQDPGFTLTITSADVADTEHRRSDGQSVVTVRAGEKLTERQALQALLLPSGNNIAIALARAVSGTADAFVDEMNVEARRLTMTSTVYTDPSGYDSGTVSTARDQLLLARAAMRIDAFATIVAQAEAAIPESGVIHNTDRLLGHDGFVGIKTGSDQAAGGCFMFAARAVHRHELVYGVVLGQRDGPLIEAALNAGQRLVDSVRSSPGLR